MIIADLYKRAIRRALRGGLAGAVGTMLAVQGLNGSGWGDIAAWLNVLAIGGVIGFITGFLMGVDKLLRDGFSE